VVEGQGSGNANKENRPINSELGNGAEKSKYGYFADVICYNCGVLGHHKARCKKNPWSVSSARGKIM
jgi:hypothetical protein